MDKSLLVPLTYQGDELEFPFKVIPQGYLTRYVVSVNDVDITFERDDSGELSAVIFDQEQIKGKLP